MMTTTMNLNAAKNGIELTFSEKPDDAIRTALKDLGFRWSNKMGIWWAKQTPERLALAESLCTPVKKAKKQTKKAKTEAEPKAEPKAKATAKAEPKAKTEKKPAELKLSELSEKCTYTIRKSNGFGTMKGYTFTATVGRKKLNLGVAKGKGGIWTVTELSTGMAITGTAEKRYLALALVTAQLVSDVYAALKTDGMKKCAKELENHNKGLK